MSIIVQYMHAHMYALVYCTGKMFIHVYMYVHSTYGQVTPIIHVHVILHVHACELHYRYVMYAETKWLRDNCTSLLLKH